MAKAIDRIRYGIFIGHHLVANKDLNTDVPSRRVLTFTCLWPCIAKAIGQNVYGVFIGQHLVANKDR